MGREVRSERGSAASTNVLWQHVVKEVAPGKWGMGWQARSEKGSVESLEVLRWLVAKEAVPGEWGMGREPQVG